MTRILAYILITIFAFPALSQDDQAAFEIGGDRFLAGSSVLLDQGTTDDLFMAGETVEVQSDVGGTALAAGRRVMLNGSIGQDAYAGGMDVVAAGPIAGDASFAGYNVQVSGAVSGDLRASGTKVTVDGPVSGYALLAGESVTLNNAVSGDVSLAGETVVFGSGASVGGKLTLYEEVVGTIEVPASVASESQIERIEIEDITDERWNVPRIFDWRSAVISFIWGVIVVTLVAALIAAVAPHCLMDMRTKVLSSPFRSLWLGFLTQSAVVGSAILFAMTIIGIFLTPASIILALIGGFFGYVVGAYAFGVGLLGAFGRPEPDTIGERALAAAVGALLVALIGLIPLLGWIFVLALTLTGVGAITARLFRPQFLVTE